MVADGPPPAPVPAGKFTCMLITSTICKVWLGVEYGGTRHTTHVVETDTVPTLLFVVLLHTNCCSHGSGNCPEGSAAPSLTEECKLCSPGYYAERFGQAVCDMYVQLYGASFNNIQIGVEILT